MTWESFYLICFLVGFILSLVSFLGQAGHIHLPGVDLHGGHLHIGGGHAGHLHAGGGDSSTGVSSFNFCSITAFLAWFGGTGYLLERHATMLAIAALGLSILAGLAGGAIVFWFMAKLAKHDGTLDPADYDMVGVLGHVSSTVRQGGIGEMVFTRDGVRSSTPIKSEDGIAIAKGVEVVVTRYERGVAYVQRWDDVSGLADSLDTSAESENSRPASL